MRFPAICALVLLTAMGSSQSPALAQRSGSRHWEQGERRALCRQSIALAGVEQDMDERIRATVREAHETAVQRGLRRNPSARAYEAALDDTLQDAKEPILERLLDSCAQTFTASELRGINEFYRSPAGRAWLTKGRNAIMPAMEQAIADIKPRMDEMVERRYCQQMGC